MVYLFPLSLGLILQRESPLKKNLFFPKVTVLSFLSSPPFVCKKYYVFSDDATP